MSSGLDQIQFVLGEQEFVLTEPSQLGNLVEDGSRAILVDGQYIIADNQTFLLQDSDSSQLTHFYLNEQTEFLQQPEIVQLVEEEQTLIYYTNDENIKEETGEHLEDEDGNVYPYKKLQEGQFLNFTELVEPEKDNIDLSKITGKDLTTGETVTLDSYMENLKKRIQKNKQTKVDKQRDLTDLIDKKISIGRTKSGKKLVGKIIHVEKKAPVQEPKKEVNTVRKTDLQGEDLNEVSKILGGLMDMDSVRKRLKEKNVIVKYVEKLFDCNKNNYVKYCCYGYGYMERICYELDGELIQRWVFLKDQATEEALTDKTAGVESKYPTSTVLTLHVIVEKDGAKAIRANLNPSQSNLCTSCNRHFKISQQYCQHLIHHQNDELIKNEEKQVLPCVLCDAVFYTQSSLKKHLVEHARSTHQHTCEICGKKFKTSSDLSLHVKVHNKSDKQFVCNVCMRTFSRHSNLMRHMVIHKGEGALYRCEICDCSYKYISSLTRHMVQCHVEATKLEQE